MYEDVKSWKMLKRDRCSPADSAKTEGAKFNYDAYEITVRSDRPPDAALAGRWQLMVMTFSDLRQSRGRDDRKGASFL